MKILHLQLKLLILIVFFFLISSDDMNNYDNINIKKKTEKELRENKIFITCGSTIRLRNYLTDT
jgi:hypothetical protein